MSNPSPTEFATAMKNGKFMLPFLWKPEGQMASSISIEKEVWLDVATGKHVLCFWLFNHVDTSKAYSPYVGGLVNKKPYNNFYECYGKAVMMYHEALESGQWVTVEHFAA